MKIHPIESADDLRSALAHVDLLWTRKEKSEKAAEELKIWSVLIEDYERRMSPIAPPTPLEAIRFRMDQLGINATRLGELMGTTRSRASEVLNGKRTLTLSMVRALTETLGLDANVLVLGARAREEPKESIPAATR